MNILIVGAGIVGFNLAQELSHEGHDISIIDADAEKIKLISEKLDVLAIRGNGCLPSTLLQGRIRDAEMVIAVTDKDEINLMVCFLAHKFEVKERFARLRNMELTGESQVFKPEELFVDHAINPAEIIIDSILKIIKTPGAVNVAEFADGQIFFRGFDVPEDAPLAGKTIEEIREVSELNAFLVVAIVREGKMIIPKYENRILAGDKIYILVDHDFLPLVLPMLNKQTDEIQKVIILGASRVAINLARELDEFIDDVSIIEPSMEKANEAADILEHTTILHGSGTDPDLFNDINMKDADLYLALSNDDEMNILSALLAKKHGAKRAVVITNDPDYLPILDSIGMDVTINPPADHGFGNSQTPAQGSSRQPVQTDRRRSRGFGNRDHHRQRGRRQAYQSTEYAGTFHHRRRLEKGRRNGGARRVHRNSRRRHSDYGDSAGLYR